VAQRQLFIKLFENPDTHFISHVVCRWLEPAKDFPATAEARVRLSPRPRRNSALRRALGSDDPRNGGWNILNAHKLLNYRVFVAIFANAEQFAPSQKFQ